MKKLLFLLLIPVLAYSQSNQRVRYQYVGADTLQSNRPGAIVANDTVKVLGYIQGNNIEAASGDMVAVRDSALVTGGLKGTNYFWLDGTTGSTPTSGAGTRLMWIPSKSAFRAGLVTGTEFDDSNIGTGSVGFGRNPTAAGNYNFASGFNSTIIGGSYNFAHGDDVSLLGTASWRFSFGANQVLNNEQTVFNVGWANSNDTLNYGHVVSFRGVPVVNFYREQTAQFSGPHFGLQHEQVADSSAWVMQAIKMSAGAFTGTSDLLFNRYRGLVPNSDWGTTTHFLTWLRIDGADNDIHLNQQKSSEFSYGDVFVDNGDFTVSAGYSDADSLRLNGSTVFAPTYNAGLSAWAGGNGDVGTFNVRGTLGVTGATTLARLTSTVNTDNSAVEPLSSVEALEIGNSNGTLSTYSSVRLKPGGGDINYIRSRLIANNNLTLDIGKQYSADGSATPYLTFVDGGAATFNSNLTVTGDAAINGGDLTSSASALNISVSSADNAVFKSDSSFVQQTRVIRKIINKTGIADNTATTLFRVTNADGGADGGTYTVEVDASISVQATSSTTNSAVKRFLASFARAMETSGTGVNSAVLPIAETASAATTGATRDIGTITMTVVETSEFLQDIQFQVDATGSGLAGTSIQITCIVELIYTGFTTAPTITSQ